uniref:hypothetical protein n=1 Tax=uncultured Caulobacter sp. TaxID=158749 RepID=UPI0025FFC26A|nr:hypothetical protein [uncultured Caulobacter sp.]
MTELISPLSSDTFFIEATIHGVTLVPRRGPHLFPAVLSIEEIDQWTAKLQRELVGLAVEMKTELRKISETPLFGNDDA